MSKNLVLLTCLCAFLGVMAWDASLYLDAVPGNSITQVVVELSSKSKLVPAFIGFLFGFLMAHFFDDSKQGEIK